MMAIPRAIRSRLLALTILAALTILVGFAVIWPVEIIFSNKSDEVRRAHLMLANYRAVASLRPNLESQLAELQKQSKSIPGLVAENALAAATAKIQGDVRSMIQSQGGQIRSTQNLPPATVNGFDKIDVRYDFAIPTNRLRELIYLIDTHVPFLVIDAVQMRVSENSQVNNPSTPPPNMDVRWTVTAYHGTAVP